MKNLSMPDLRRDISSWESVLNDLRKHIYYSQEIVKIIESKMQTSEKLLMEAHKMRQFESQ